MKPGAKIVRFIRAIEPGKPSFVEQEMPLGAVKVGWIVSATTKHEGNREMAEAGQDYRGAMMAWRRDGQA